LKLPHPLLSRRDALSPAYLRGIETAKGSKNKNKKARSPAYLRGIETYFLFPLACVQDKSPAYLRGIETLNIRRSFPEGNRVSSLPKRN